MKLGNWDNPSKKYHIGIKAIYHLMPGPLLDRVKKEKKNENDSSNRFLLETLNQELAQSIANKDKDLENDIKERIECLNKLSSSHADVGPLVDVIAFLDSNNRWRVAIDCKGDGDLTNVDLLTDYRLERQVGCFGEKNMFNFVVNIWEEGNTVEIVTDSGTHGTHVAGISAGYFPESPELNGIAPGAQIISCKIGDSRIGGMETGTGLLRALIAAKRNNVDLVNISFGEYVQKSNSGRVVSFMEELVNDHGIIVVSSASNSGPCISTVSAPSSSTPGVISVAAYVSPNMTKIQHLLPGSIPETMTDWSSRGPTDDGFLGVSVCAPGGAIASVPNWTLQNIRLMEGTSMASPNACGCIALVLSGLKQESKKYSPYSITVAIQNTARDVNLDQFTQGYGLIQVIKTYDFFSTTTIPHNVRIDARDISTGNRGLYLRDRFTEFKPSVNQNIKLSVHFSEGTPNKEKIDFSMKLAIKSTQDWIHTPSYGVLTSGGVNVIAKVKPPTQEGLYYGEVLGYDSDNLEQGPVFRYSVTVINPKHIISLPSKMLEEKISLVPGETKFRRFYRVSENTSWATVEFSGDVQSTRLIFFGAMQLVDNVSCRKTHIEKVFYLTHRGYPYKFSFPVYTGRVLEVCFSQFWKSMEDSGTVDYKIEFQNIRIHHDPISMNQFNEISLIPLQNNSHEALDINATLYASQHSLYPISSDGPNRLCSIRDDFGKGRRGYELVLTYTYETDTPNCTIMLSVQTLCEVLYESPYDSQLCLIYNNNKKYLGTSDAFPKWITLKDAGTYTFRVQIRHEDPSALESMKSHVLLVDRKLPNDKKIELAIKDKLNVAMTGTGGLKPNFGPGTQFSIMLRAPKKTQLPSYVKPGYSLYGYLTFNKEQRITEPFNKNGLSPIPGAVKVIFNVPKFGQELDKKEEDNELLLIPKALGDYYISLLKEKKADEASEFKNVLLTLKAISENKIATREIEFVAKSYLSEDKHEIIKACDELVESLGPLQNLVLATTPPGNEFVDKDYVANAAKYKTILIRALKKKVECYKDLSDSENGIKAIEALKKWTPTTAKEYFDVNLWSTSQKAPGATLKKLLTEGRCYSNKDHYDLYISLLKSLKWTHWVTHEEEAYLIHFPSDFERF